MSNDTKKESPLLYRGLVGNNKTMQALRELIVKVAPSKANVLITGETGTGKEIVARNIHYLSGQREGRFVPINCSAIPPELLESELFGHKKGSFTGATADHAGRFAFAAGGTLFLDEIGDMSPSLQVKMLRVLEERVIYRVGDNHPVPMTARLVAATHQNLEQSVRDGRFREDLFYRLNVVPLVVPPLRERRDDIAILTTELGHRLKREQAVTVELTPAIIDKLAAHDWPGNVRELANLIERLAVTHPNGIADVADLPEAYRDIAACGTEISYATQELPCPDFAPQLFPEGGIDLKDHLKSTEAALIRGALSHCNGTITQAASLLSIGRTTLTEKVKRLGLSNCLKAAE